MFRKLTSEWRPGSAEALQDAIRNHAEFLSETREAMLGKLLAMRAAGLDFRLVEERAPDGSCTWYRFEERPTDA